MNNDLSFYNGCFDQMSNENLTDEYYDYAEGLEQHTYGGYHDTKIGELYGNYRIEAKLGWGEYSTVWLATDWTYEIPRYVILKIFKSEESYTMAGHDEAAILNYLKLKYKPIVGFPYSLDQYKLIQYYDTITINGNNGSHLGLVMEVVGPSLLDYLKFRKNNKVNINTIKKIIKDILEALDYMHTNCSILHADLKPENILIKVKCIPWPAYISRWLRDNAIINGTYNYSAITYDYYNDVAYQLYKLSSIGKEASTEGRCNARKIDTSNDKEDILTINDSRTFDYNNYYYNNENNIEELSITKNNNINNSTIRSTNKQLNDNDIFDNQDTYNLPNDWNSESNCNNVLSSNGVQTMNKTNMQTSLLQHTFDEKSLCDPLSLPFKDLLPMQINNKYLPIDGYLKSYLIERTGLRNNAIIITNGICTFPESLYYIFNSSDICAKIVDFGSSIYNIEPPYNEIQTRYYRAPEVILGCPYSYSADIWSLACILFELITGDYLFFASSSSDFTKDDDQLACIVETLGCIPESIVKEATKKRLINDDGLPKNIKKLFPWGLESILILKYKLDAIDVSYLTDFLLAMLNLNYKERVDAKHLLQHPWLNYTEIPKNKIRESDCYTSIETRIQAKYCSDEILKQLNNIH